ncbi:Dabb family protein [Cesiribacter andamanensis]|uniref:Stress responsive A/B Barrel Domain protein n=1 Tax=Cesiribacter andamanensis AMV16 TaxID=1279009 RepID=M7NRU3_9BACT|nr:Dabb family protein [Cesiribacter andamanensis]EMR04415.1 Stress responsive A/B Barrel Domain protein [Cesiribacter andamanensis AMV16]
MFVHHVFFWMKNPDSSLEREQLEEGLLSLEKIDLIRSFHVGVLAETNRKTIDRSYAFSLLMLFDNPEDEEAYQSHPIHKKFVADCSPLWSKVLVYDSVDE